jgi:hypothetical protein
LVVGDLASLARLLSVLRPHIDLFLHHPSAKQLIGLIDDWVFEEAGRLKHVKLLPLELA